ncbi:MAG: hypothetical protein JNJ73_20825 [Hyphomonadaceae bacterium]|nr:hypothetical protein [Hyphomonadaceae bacterium]
MSTLQFVETSLRDGNQSLWGALGLDTAKTLTIAPVMERAGFRAIDFTTSTHMGVAVRYKKEDPWERIRLMAEICKTTPLQFMGTGFRFISWESAHPDFMALAFKTLARNGIRRFCMADPMTDADAMIECARMAKAGGAEIVVCALVYSISPIHDDAFYAERAAKLAACPDVDIVYVKDPGGLLTPKRARALVETAQRELKGKPLEMHCHCTIGLGDLAYAEAAELGVAALQCASGAAADGTSNPPAERVLANLCALGHDVDVDAEAVREIGGYFTALARAEGLPEGKPAGFDAAYMRHQLPGGMVSTMRRHLAESRLDGIEQAVIEELGRVREELGWPIVMTPFSQILLGQAVINVTGHERYATVPDELIRYALGRFGRPNIPIDGNIMDRIRALPRAKEIEAEAGPLPPEELRKRFKKGISDEEFLLRATMPEGQVDAMLAAGPAPRRYEPASRAAIEALRQATQSDAAHIDIERPNFKLSLRRSAA